MTSSRSYPAGAARRFPSTRYSVLEAVRAADPAARRQAWDDLVAGYWAPVCGYLRWQCGVEAEDARDLTQEFFTTAFDRGTFDRFDPARAHFRTYLRLCLDGFAANHRKAAARLKRGGGRPQVSLSTPTDSFPGSLAEQGEHPAPPDPEEVFHREWVRGLFALAVADLRRQCLASGRAMQYQVFARYDLGMSASPGTSEPERSGEPGSRPRYDELAAELGIAPSQVTNHLAAARRRLRHLVLLYLRRLTASETEFRSEARALLGIESFPGD
jgi:RNA polymerase sigma factor (sigma-70 family)